MPILTASGRIVIAESIEARPIHLAWGLGDGAWTTPPSEDSTHTSLINEIGRLKASEVAYVVLDPTGDINTPTGIYKRSVTPTNSMLLGFNFDFDNASSSVIREIAVFVGCTTNPALPGGQTYFVPADIVASGRLLHLENLAPIFRSPSIRENFQIVITF